MYCNHCGTEVPEHGAFCSNCGRPIVLNHVQPVKSDEEKILGSIVGILFGLSLAGGGVYSALNFTGYTRWAIAGGVSAVLAGISCAVKCVHLLYKTRKGHRG